MSISGKHPQGGVSNFEGDNYVYGGVVDPTVTPIQAPRGSLWVQVGRVTGDPIGLFQKQDNGKTTNWIPFSLTKDSEELFVAEDSVRTFFENETSPRTKTKHVNVFGDYAYVSMHEDLGGFNIFDVSEVRNPIEISSVSSPQSVNKTALNDDASRAYTFINAGPVSIEVWDVTDKSNPVKLGQSPIVGGQYFNGEYSNGHVYAANTNASGVNIINVQNETSPTFVTTVGSNVGDAKISGNTLFFTNFNTATLFAYDISNPATPVLLGSVSVGTMPVAFLIEGSHAYVEEFSGTQVHIVDISNPASMSVLSSVQTLRGTLLNIGSLAVENNILYAQTNSAIFIFDVSDKANPVYLLGYDLPSSTFQSINNKNNLKDGHIISADRSPDRLVVFKNPFIYNNNVEMAHLEVTDQLVIRNDSNNVPVAAGSPGKKGTIVWDNDFIYICVATDTWKRVGIATF